MLAIGGMGGAGGGASAALTNEAITDSDGSAVFEGTARLAPGTGGGGGGGFVQLVVGGSLTLQGTGKILANGGDAYQSFDLGANGGGPYSFRRKMP